MPDDQEPSAGEHPEPQGSQLDRIQRLVEENADLTRQVLELTGEVHALSADVHRLTAHLAATVGQAASRAVLATREADVADALGLQVEDRFTGGVHGALGVRSHDGTRLVLKVVATEREAEVRHAVEIAGRLRARGVPVPDPYLVGKVADRVFTLQQRCEGETPRPLRAVHARAMLDAWERLPGACPEGGPWPEDVARALTVGEASLWVDHGPVRAAGDRASALLDEIVAVGAGVDPGRLSSTDAVHMDWHHRNVLVAGDAVTALFDWELARPGDARFDLVVLAYWSEVYRGSEVDDAAADEIGAFVAARVDPEVRAWLAALQAASRLRFTAVNRPDLLAEVTADVDRYLAPWWRRPRPRADAPTR